MKLASIEKISRIAPHKNADKLELAYVLGWQTVVKKGEYKPGDKVVFINIDTIVPRCLWSEFLCDKNNPDKPIRIKNIKLRGEYSSGLVVSLDNFPAFFSDKEEGTDVSEDIGIKKYIKEIPANLAGENEGDFPSHIVSKTDEDNGLSHPDVVERVLESPVLTITRKLDGSSMTVIVEDGVITKVCSRNLAKKDTSNSVFWKVAKRLNIPDNWTGAIQGELMGNGIQGNQLELDDHDLYVFQIMEGKEDKRRYFTYDEMAKFCTVHLNCNVVPLVLVLEKSKTFELWTNPIEKLQFLADNQVLSNGKQAEGIVVRPQDYIRSYESRRPLGFKLINRNYNDT